MASTLLSSRVELFVKANNLPKLDLTSKSDPFVELHIKNARGEWMRADKSEVIWDNQNPAFAKQFVLDYRFEEVQPVKLVLWDYDNTSSADYLGEAETNMGRIMGSKGSTQTLPLTYHGAAHPEISKGTVTISGDEIKGSNDVLRVQFRAANLDKKDWFGSSDPFITISRVKSDGSRMKVWESGVIKNNLNPVWPVVDVPIQVLCNGDVHAPLVATVTDWDKDGSHDLIGEVPITVDLICAAPLAGKFFPLVNPTKATKKSYVNSGILHVQSAAVIRVPSFLEYIQGGCNLSLVVAIDYTGSNGDPRLPTSLHSFVGSAPNEYVQATAACSDVVLEYDADKMVPAFGFGGSVSGGPVNHCFALNFTESNPEVPGLDGILQAYRNSFSYVALSGPTYFAPIIQRAAEMASVGVSQQNQRYTVLLLITDGQCNDIDATTRAVIDASGLPLSIIIVGVGAADFSAMEFLDSDSGALTYGTRKAVRDIVQFVPFRKFSAAGVGAGSLLAQEVLKEVPSQLCSYFMSNRILPNPKPIIAAPHGAPGVFPMPPIAPVMPVAGAGVPLATAPGAPPHIAPPGHPAATF